jgi:hypothetical protein
LQQIYFNNLNNIILPTLSMLCVLLYTHSFNVYIIIDNNTRLRSIIFVQTRRFKCIYKQRCVIYSWMFVLDSSVLAVWTFFVLNFNIIIVYSVLENWTISRSCNNDQWVQLEWLFNGENTTEDKFILYV